MDASNRQTSAFQLQRTQEPAESTPQRQPPVANHVRRTTGVRQTPLCLTPFQIAFAKRAGLKLNHSEHLISKSDLSARTMKALALETAALNNKQP